MKRPNASIAHLAAFSKGTLPFTGRDAQLIERYIASLESEVENLRNEIAVAQAYALKQGQLARGNPPLISP